MKDGMDSAHPRRVTQRDVAQLAGVHRATVSLAYRNHPSIPAETRDRILLVGSQLGYSPDPMLSALAAYRERSRPSAFQGTLAWLTDSTRHSYWKKIACFRDYHAGAKSRALQHGFQLEECDLGAPDMTPQRIASILRARNINGILLPPQSEAESELGLPWDDFSAVAFGYSLSRPRLHTVAPSQYRSTLRVMHELRALGYRRIGFMFMHDHDRRTEHNYLAGYLVNEVLAAAGRLNIPPCFGWYRKPDEWEAWLHDYKPDVIVTGPWVGILDALSRRGLRVPGDIGIACPCLYSREDGLAGVIENSIHIGEVAVDTLVAMIQRGERGIPEYPQHIQVEGDWVPGRTLRDFPVPSIS